MTEREKEKESDSDAGVLSGEDLFEGSVDRTEDVADPQETSTPAPGSPPKPSEVPEYVYSYSSIYSLSLIHYILPTCPDTNHLLVAASTHGSKSSALGPS